MLCGFLVAWIQGEKKELVFQSYLTVSNKLKCAYWPACITAGFAPLLGPTARPYIFHRCTQEKKLEKSINVCKQNLYFVIIICFNMGFTIVPDGVSCSCRLTQTPRAKTIQSSPSRPFGGARLHGAPTHAWSADFFFLSAEPRGGRSSLHTLKDLRAITEQPQLLIYLVVLLFVYFCIKVRIKWLKPGIMKVVVPVSGGRAGGLLQQLGLQRRGKWLQQDRWMVGGKLNQEGEIMC